jgi:inosose dehydratase
VLDEIKATGYDGTELGDWGFMPTDPCELRTALDRRDLSLIAAWVTTDLITPARRAENAERAVRTARLLAKVGGERSMIVVGGNLFAYEERNRVVGRVRPGDAMADDQWPEYVDGVHHIARRVRDEAGLRTVFHPHCATWIESPGEIARFLDLTDPDLVGLCLDTGHYAFGGGDPVAGLQRHAARVWHVHFKDCSPEIAEQARRNRWNYNSAVGEGLFCELGAGGVDFPAIVKLLSRMDFKGWVVVEQDVLPGMGTPREAAQRNRAYLRTIGL